MSAENDLMIAHALDFTRIEDVTLREWFDLDAANLEPEAAQVLHAGLMLEHYTSLLPHDPEARSVEQVTTQNKLLFDLSDAIRRGRDALARRAARPSTHDLPGTPGNPFPVTN